MQNYKQLIHDILLTGETSMDRTGTGTISKFGSRLEWDLAKGFPATTTKTLAWKSVVSELLWFLSGSTNTNDLREILHGSRTEGRTIWDANFEHQAVNLGYLNGDLGPVYGAQFHHNNQLNNFIEGIKNNPKSRRHIISLWNTDDLKDMALPPCHGLVIQAFVSNDNKLSIQWYQRSVDSFLGLPFNIASYALFTHILASILGLGVGKLIYVGGDTHIYTNHVSQCEELLSRKPLPLPSLEMPSFSTIDEVIITPISSFKLTDYKSHGSIKADMAV